MSFPRSSRFPASRRNSNRPTASMSTSNEPRTTWKKNDGAGNTFKATAKPVLIGTAVVGATTMIFSIVVALTDGLKPELLSNLSILHPPFLLGLIAGGRDDLLVHRRFDAGRHHRRLSRRGIHQERTSIWKAPPRRRSPTARKWSRSARSMRRRACSTSS